MTGDLGSVRLEAALGLPPAPLFDGTLRADGSRLAVWDNGGVGLPVLVCNGLGTSPYAWPALLDPGSGVHAVGWDYPGLGASDRPTDPDAIRVEDHVTDALRTLDHYGLDRALLACWSIGVNVGFELAARHPERVSGVLAVAGVPGGTFGTMLAPLHVPRPLRHPISTGVARAGRVLGAPLTVTARAVPKTDATAWLLAHTGFMLPKAGTQDVRRTITEFLAHDFGWYFRVVQAAAEHETLDLASIDVPSTLLAGRWDLLTAWDEVVAASRRLPDAEVHVLPGSHFLPLEYPERILSELHDLAVRAGQD